MFRKYAGYFTPAREVHGSFTQVLETHATQSATAWLEASGRQVSRLRWTDMMLTNTDVVNDAVTRAMPLIRKIPTPFPSYGAAETSVECTLQWLRFNFGVTKSAPLSFKGRVEKRVYHEVVRKAEKAGLFSIDHSLLARFSRPFVPVPGTYKRPENVPATAEKNIQRVQALIPEWLPKLMCLGDARRWARNILEKHGFTYTPHPGESPSKFRSLVLTAYSAGKFKIMDHPVGYGPQAVRQPDASATTMAKVERKLSESWTSSSDALPIKEIVNEVSYAPSVVTTLKHVESPFTSPTPTPEIVDVKADMLAAQSEIAEHDVLAWTTPCGQEGSRTGRANGESGTATLQHQPQ
ncbi:hypothetical protein EK21DRAFT_118852 [Setomelanomma holmii]|uniref:Uncharacterized protein n=1 Tax=Setomelanomma holmii TaxID=210430 RepID=A0A9P4GUX5_9PLEO|nr:hypothetical protein EK21DRAFT_118852 [Setomelanomma holmii]